jgi:carbon storage regulator
MLVLSRHRDESIMIGDDIVITVVDLRGDKVRLGIDAPKEIPVHRQEVHEALEREAENYYKEFQENLNSKDYETAFNMIYENRTDSEQWIYKRVNKSEMDQIANWLYDKSPSIN